MMFIQAFGPIHLILLIFLILYTFNTANISNFYVGSSILLEFFNVRCCMYVVEIQFNIRKVLNDNFNQLKSSYVGQSSSYVG